MQGDGPFTDGINVTIRRNYIYEDAYDKLSPENGTETHIKRLIQVILHTSAVLAVLLSTCIYLFSFFIEVYLASG